MSEKNAKLIEQLNKDKKTIQAANPNKLRDSVFDRPGSKTSQARSRTTEGMKDYGETSKKSRVLKLGGGKYYFPKRQRFNENLQAEVESIKSNVTRENQRERLAKLIEQNKAKEDGNLTSENLKEFFSQKTSPEELLSYVTSRKAGTAEVKERPRMTRIKVDCGNKRYAASQVSSFAGGLLNG